MIDIIIPVYNSRETLIYTLMSIACQTILDKVNVYIIDDASSESYDDIIEMFSFEIHYYRLDKNVGSGLAREYGLSNSNGEYVLFIDSDDLFYNGESLKFLYNAIVDNDLSYGKVYSEEDNQFNYTLGDLHGKLYRRDFLLKNDIHFNNSRYHEDNAFNNLVLIHQPRYKVVNNVVYYYCFNSSSLTHQSESRKYEIYIDNMDYVINIAKMHNCDRSKIVDYVFRKYMYLSIVFNNLDVNEQNIIKESLARYSFDIYINDLSDNERKAISILL